MAILSGIPVLTCQSIETTLDFYQQLFQFVIVKKRESEGQLCWVHIMHGSTTLMLQNLEQSHPEKQNLPQTNISLYFFINNISELYHLIKVKYHHVSELRLTQYQMQEFDVTDPEGNTVTVGQTVNQE